MQPSWTILQSLTVAADAAVLPTKSAAESNAGAVIGFINNLRSVTVFQSAAESTRVNMPATG
jgi:hypothetical protein